ncbi:hypothetical protein SUGI_0012440 [Cryptomeria japonica]|uniref:uncharacterized protein LOC131041935 n=1 Tax=Cryptomeria japonica TaxID=3369 RepID=UPI0024089B76|nr:uncharacterized protein LOC131041935 [Cryptomeria japonica]GLJ05161.1 hypothetical protein SUGI_0012440 [Cryptomeria japonica]
MFCIECGTHDNPCRCKVVGPTLGFLLLLITALVLWPVGAIVFIFNKAKGRKIMSKPVNHIYPAVSHAIPI